MSTTLLCAPSPATAGDRPTSPESRLARWCMRHRWLVLALSTLALVLGVLTMGALGIRTTPAAEQLVGDSARAVAIQQAAGFDRRPTEMIVVTAAQHLDAEQVSGLGGQLRAAYTGVSSVAAVGTPFPGQDGRSVVLPVVLDAAAPDDPTSGRPAAMDAVAPVLDATARFAAAHPGLTVGQVGDGSVDREVDRILGTDFQRAELFSVPVTLLVLLIAFGAVVAAGVPILLGLGSVAMAFGLTAAASQGLVSVDPNAQSLVLLIGLAVGVDYALFVIQRSREERAAGADRRTAIAVACGTAGRAVVISGITVVVAMSGMLVAGGLFTSLALGAVLVVLVAVVASATTLPALLAVLGDRIEALRLPFTARRIARAGTARSMWGRLAGRVTRRPVAWGLTAAALLAGLAVPALGMRTSLGGMDTLPADLPIVRAYHQLETAVPSDGTAAQIVVRAPASAAAAVHEALGPQGVVGTARSLAHVTAIAPEPQVNPAGTVTTVDIGIGLTASDERLEATIAQIRATVVPAIESSLSAAGVQGAEVHVGGAAATTDLARWMHDRLPWVVAFVLVLTLLVMAVSFGSIPLALVTVGLNLLSVGAAYGIVTAVFQGTWAQGPLDFTSTGTIIAWLPMLMFVILFGLSMDYHVFVTSRVREAYAAGLAAPEAVRIGVARSAGVVSSAAAVMVAVFAIFATLSILEMKQLGVGLATAVLLDATVVRGVLLPATLTLLGDRAHRGPRWLPTLHH